MTPPPFEPFSSTLDRPADKAPNQTERRRYARKRFQVEAEVIVGSWPNKKKFRTRIRDVSPIGLGLDYAPVFYSGDAPVTVRCPIPLEWNPSARTKAYKLEGTLLASGGVRLRHLISEQTRVQDASAKKVFVAFAALLLAGLIVLLKSRNVISFWYQPIFQIYSLAASIYVLSRVGLSMFYREPKDNGILPKVSVIIAAKNEEEHIDKMLDHCFQSRYPTDLMDVMVIDDGSTDKTWDVLQTLSSRWPGLRSFRFEKNRGKRHAMALGCRKATGDILVFLDSDSLLEPEAIYRIVQPFKNPKVGAVAGHTLVIVEPHNFISKMEAVRYYVSQRIMKAAESVFDAVTCCPGPLSAYRRAAMLAFLPTWEGQTFLGTPATFGDDRSLTNFILPNYRVVYHAGARCATYVPNKWKVFFRQQVRWKKSWVRETTIAVRFMWKKNPIAALAYYVSILITLFSPLIALRAMLYLPAALGSFSFLPYLAGLLLVYTFFGLIYQYHTQSKRWMYGLAFALLYVFILSFQNYYAMLTVRRNHWGTR